MNDSTETKYFDEYVSKNYGKFLKDMSEESRKNVFSPSIDYHYYITSLMSKKNFDNLDMWRIYGDNAKGVMIEYEIIPNLLRYPFYLTHVLYETSKDRNGSVLFMFNLLRHKFDRTKLLRLQHWNVWKHMFKSYEYRNEFEIRLLYVSKDASKWVLNKEFNILMPMKLFSIDQDNPSFPLKIKRVFLGPRMPEKKANEEMLSSLLNENGLSQIEVKHSLIKSYR